MRGNGRRMGGWLLGAGLLLAVAPAARAVLFQYQVEVPGDKPSSALVWIPAAAAQVRGVVLAGTTLMEAEFVRDPAIRAACADQQLALIYLRCGLGTPALQAVLDNAARVSGYREIAVAPLFFVGHSAGGPQAHDAAVKFAARCFGLIQYRGGGPWNGVPIEPGIPTLMMVGQYDEFSGVMKRAGNTERWEGYARELADFRATNENRLASIVIEPGAGHFPWSDRNARYAALFLAKAAAARIPATWPTDAKEPPALRAIPATEGWLTDLTIKAPGVHAPAAHAGFTGDKARANWHLDRELAEATVAYHAGGFGKKDQFIKWNDPYWVDAGTRFFFTSLKWIDDGRTFAVQPVYADAYPQTQRDGEKKPIGPQWLEAGQPVGHASAPIRLKRAAGPIEPVGDKGFRMSFDALAPATERARTTFMAYSAGDAEYRFTEQVGMMPRGFKGLDGGKAQALAFPPIANLKADAAPVKLEATSDAGLPVEYYVAYGPAVVEAGMLKLAEVPARAAFPIEVAVVAWQFGSGIEPKVKTAEPLTRTFLIEKP